MKRWKKDISGITKFKDLPEEAKDYVKKIEELTDIPVIWVGTGAERESIILRKKYFLIYSFIFKRKC